MFDSCVCVLFLIFFFFVFLFHCCILRIPVIGGKELDLHILYVEVTKRGGYEKVWLCYLIFFRM